MICAIIQARMGSSRLPGKMTELLGSKPLIWHVIDRVKKAKLVDKVVLATSVDPANNVLMQKAEEFGIKAFAGDEDDVLDRFYRCAKDAGADAVIRITGDCPFIDPDIIDGVVSLFKESEGDYASNIHPPTYPDGMDVEVFSFTALEKAWSEAKLKSEREHVTPYIWKNKDIFRQANMTNNVDLSDMRLTVDEREDLVFMNEVLKRLDGEFTLADIVKVIRDNPDLKTINDDFERNEGYEKSLQEDKVI